MARYIDYRFVLKNYTLDEIDAIKAWDCRYLLIGYEVSTLNSVPNVQGYVYWNYPKKLSACYKLNSRICWRPCSMSPAAQKEDCTNNAVDIWQKGECPMRPTPLKRKRVTMDINYLNQDGSWVVISSDEIFPPPEPIYDESFKPLHVAMDK